MVKHFRTLTDNRKHLLATILTSIGALILLGLGPAIVIVVMQSIAFSMMVLAMLLVLPSLKEEWEYMGSIDWFRKELHLVQEEPVTSDTTEVSGETPDKL